jgi:hypothetical protein
MFVFPIVWPSTFKPVMGQGRDLVRLSLDNMACDPLFGSLMVALLKSPQWLTKEFKEFFKVSALDASVVQAKRLLHFAYDLSNGHMNKKRIAAALSLARKYTSHDDNAYDFEHFAGSADGPDGPNGTHKSLTLAQMLLAFDAEKFFSDTYDSDDLGGAAAVAHALEGPSTSFFDTTSYNVDAFGRLLRVAVITVCCIQRLHLNVLKNQRTMNHAMLPKFTRTYTIKKKKIKATDYDEIWRNYVFDIAACWMVIQRFFASCQNEDPKEMIHALHKARIWSLTTGVAGSSNQMRMIEKHQVDTLDKISQLGLFLHQTLLRLWPIGLQALHTKGHGSASAVKRAIARISACVFVRSSEESKSDMPDCGTATIVDNHWTFTMLQNSQLGIYDGHFGSRVEDLNHSVYAGALSDAITRTTSHLWAACVSHQVWNQLDAGLPEVAEMDERIMPLLKAQDITLADLNEQGIAFRKSFFKNREAEENAEIDSIVSRVA